MDSESFELRSDSDFISISFDEVYGFPSKTFYTGGYELEAALEIKSGCYQVKTKYFTSTGEIYGFFLELKECHQQVSGSAKYSSSEGNFKFETRYDDLGHVTIKGSFQEDFMYDNILEFEIISDQTFMKYTLDSLERIFLKYGDMKGINE
jgi:hypothetical protein